MLENSTKAIEKVKELEDKLKGKQSDSSEVIREIDELEKEIDASVIVFKEIDTNKVDHLTVIPF